MVNWNVNLTSTFSETWISLSFDFFLNTIITYLRFLSWAKLFTLHYVLYKHRIRCFHVLKQKHNPAFKMWILPIFTYHFSDNNIIMTTSYIFLIVASSNLCNLTKCGAWSTRQIKSELMITFYKSQICQIDLIQNQENQGYNRETM